MVLWISLAENGNKNVIRDFLARYGKQMQDREDRCVGMTQKESAKDMVGYYSLPMTPAEFIEHINPLCRLAYVFSYLIIWNEFPSLIPLGCWFVCFVYTVVWISIQLVVIIFYFFGFDISGGQTPGYCLVSIDYLGTYRSMEFPLPWPLILSRPTLKEKSHIFQVSFFYNTFPIRHILNGTRFLNAFTFTAVK